MSIFDRITTAISVLAGRQKALPYRIQNQNDPSHYQRWDNTYRVYAEEGFNLNSIVYGAIMYKIRAITSAPLRAYTNDLENPEPLPQDHPMQVLMRKPNPHMSGRFLQSLRTLYFNLSGNSYILVVRQGLTPVALYPLRPDRVYTVPMSDNTIAYAYVPDGKTFDDALPILAEDMMHDKMPHPLDDLEGLGQGLSPMSAAAAPADGDNKLTAFLNIMVDRGVMPSGMIVSDQMLTDRDADRIRRRFMEKYGGVENWGDVMVQDNRVKYERLGMTLEEMVVENWDRRNEARILQTLGVSPILAGSVLGMDSSTYSNYETARQIFWQDVLSYEMGIYEDENDQRLGMDGQFRYMHDVSKVPALREDIGARASAAKTLWDMGTPLNLATRTAGIDMEEVEGGDTPYISGLVAPANQPDESPTDTNLNESDETETDNPDGDDETEDAEAMAYLPRKAVLRMLDHHRDILGNLQGNYNDIAVYFDNFGEDAVSDICRRYHVNPNHRFFADLNKQLRAVCVAIAQSGYAQQRPPELVTEQLQAALAYVSGTTDHWIMDRLAVSDQTINTIVQLRQTVLYGNMAKATTTILFVDNDVAITEDDVDAAIADVSDNDFLHGLLTSTIDDSEGET